MRMPPRRINPVNRWPVLVFTLALIAGIAAARPARAQLTGIAGTTGTTVTPTTLTSDDFFIGIQSTEGINLNVYDLPRFFNKANCDCDVPVYVYVTLTASGLAKRSTFSTTTAGKFQIWVGSMCDQPLLQPGRCTKLVDETLTTFMADGRTTSPATSARIFSTDTTSLVSEDGGVETVLSGTPVPTPDCVSNEVSFTQTVYVLIDVDGDGTYDVIPAPVQSLYVDLVPPPPPANPTVQSGNEAIVLNWTPVDYSTNMDLAGYQILCRRGFDLQVFPGTTFAEYVKTCSKDLTTGEQGPESLNPNYACSPLLNRSDSSYRVKILQNGIVYGATVVAVDNSGNASAPFVQYATPEKTDSFYDVYRNGENSNAGPTSPAGAASGGFGAGAGRGAAGPRSGLRFALGAGVALALALVHRRRRRRRP